MTYGFTSGGIAMTPLRQRMTEDMQLRGLAPATQQAYLRYVEQLAVFTGKSPDLATDEDFRQFFLALHKQRGLSRSTATVAIAAFKFLFEHTLQRPWPRLELFRPRPTQTLPVILSVDEVWRILDQLDHPTYYTCLATIYTCGLRISEGVNLQVSWIDSARMHPHPAPPPVAHPSQSSLALSSWGRCPEGSAHCHGADYHHQCAACLSPGAYRRWRDQASVFALLAPFLGHQFA